MKQDYAEVHWAWVQHMAHRRIEKEREQQWKTDVTLDPSADGGWALHDGVVEIMNFPADELPRGLYRMELLEYQLLVLGFRREVGS